MKKIVFFVTTLDSGGLENYLLRFINYTHTADFKYIVWCKSGLGGDLEQNYSKKCLVIKSKLGFWNFFEYLKLFHFLRKEKINTVCDFTGNFSGLPLTTARLAQTKIRIAFYRGSEDHFKKNTIKNIYNKTMNYLTFYNSTKILSNSQTALDYFFPNKGIYKFEVIYNGIDSNNIIKYNQDKKNKIRNLLNIPNDAFVIGHTGRYDIAKNHQTIISVALKLCANHDNIYFVLIGKNVDTAFANIITQNGLENKIKLLGYRKDVLELLHIFDLFYFPSLTEGQPNSLIEAMVTGIPILASNIAPIKECVPESIKKNLLPPLDQESAINAIENIISNKNKLLEYIVKDWAVCFFDGEKLFNKFKNNL